MKRLAVVLTLTIAAIGCSKSQPTVAAAPPHQAPKIEPEKKVTVSPEVQALLKPDPDVEQRMTPEEIKATLAAAQSQPVRSASADLPGTSSAGEWSKMEGDQKAKLDAWHQYLEGTTVYSFNGSYHTRICQDLNAVYRDPATGIAVRRFMGSAMTLEQARSGHLSRHADCGAPSYEPR